MERLVLSNFTPGLVDEEVISRTELEGTASPDCMNIEYTPRGTLTVREGYQQLNASTLVGPGAPITNIYQWTSRDNLDYTLVLSPYVSAGATAMIWTMETPTVTWDTKVVCAGEVWRPLYTTPVTICSYAGSAVMTYPGNLAPVAWNGSDEMLDLRAAPSGVACVTNWGNYLFLGNYNVGSTKNGSRVCWNSIGVITNWPSTYYLDLDPDDGDEIKAMINLGANIIVFKRRKMFKIHYAGGTMIFMSERISNKIGCVGPHAVCEHDGILYFLCEDGVYSYDGAAPPKELSMSISHTIDDLRKAMLYRTQSTVVQDKHQIWFAVPGPASPPTEVPNLVLVYDYQLNNWTKFDIQACGLGMYKESSDVAYEDLPEDYDYYTDSIASYGAGAGSWHLAIGTMSGDIHKYGAGIKVDDGVAIGAYWATPWLDLGNPEINKRIIRLTAILDKEATNPEVDLDIYADWNATTPVLTETISLAGVTPVLEQRVDVTRHIRSCRFKLSVDTAGYSFTLHKLIVDYLNKGRTKTA